MKEENITLASMHSISKGFYGECGRRGGYLELMNVDSDVVAEFYKLASINLCSNVNGQICMAMVMNPPKVRFSRAINHLAMIESRRGSWILSPDVVTEAHKSLPLNYAPLSIARSAWPWSWNSIEVCVIILCYTQCSVDSTLDGKVVLLQA